MMLEKEVTAFVLLAVAKYRNIRIFRNNVGMAWTGKSTHLKNGNVLIENARPLHAGLCVGSSDFIGWRTVTITPAMVGRKVAQFTALEMKRSRSANRRPEQINFLKTVQEAGGLAAFVASEKDLESVLNDKD